MERARIVVTPSRLRAGLSEEAVTLSEEAVTLRACERINFARGIKTLVNLRQSRGVWGGTDRLR